MVTRQSATVSAWAYPNIHGDITYTIDQTGAKAGPFLYDPYGQPLSGVANTGPGDMDGGWLGQHQRPTEHQPELKPTIEMGARPYRPDLGRFLRVDPIDGGATHSNYAYPGDPINQSDLDGKCRRPHPQGNLEKCVAALRRYAAVMATQGQRQIEYVADINKLRATGRNSRAGHQNAINKLNGPRDKALADIAKYCKAGAPWWTRVTPPDKETAARVGLFIVGIGAAFFGSGGILSGA